MAIFVIIPQPEANIPRLPAAIKEHFAGANYALDGNSGWLVVAKSTAKEISDKLQITDGTNGAAIVIEVASYFGRANPNTWTWIKANWDGPQNA
jgi:hypothetical protein